jgi:hypothetical protein
LKSYHDIAGDGGSRIAEQVEAGREKIARALSGVRHRVAVGSGKGGVGKSTLTPRPRLGAGRTRALGRDPRCGPERPDPGADVGPRGRRTGSRARGSYAPPLQGRRARLLDRGDGSRSPGLGVRVGRHRRRPHVAGDEGVRGPGRAARCDRVGAPGRAPVRLAAGGRADGAIRRFPRSGDIARPRHDSLGGIPGRGGAVARRGVQGFLPGRRLRREHEWATSAPIAAR